MHINDIKFTKKLPAAFVILTLVMALAMSWMGYRDFRSSLIDQTVKKLDILVKERASAIESWFERLDSQVKSYSDDPTVIQAIQGFGSTFGLLMEDPVAELQAAYITDNPNPVGEKDLYDRAPESIPYHFQHETFHPFFRTIKDYLNLYDVFLFDADGNLIYSVYKETDFATNFRTGLYADSGLGRAYEAALNAAPGSTIFMDFTPYAPSADNPASFIATPVVGGQGNVIGVFAVQVPGDQISAAINNPVGLGRTSEMTLIAPDLTARSASRFEERHQILADLNPNSLVASAFEQGEVTYTEGPNLAGENAIGVAKALKILDQDWLLVGETTMEEASLDAVVQRNKTLVLTAGAMVIIGLIGWLISRSLTAPLTDIVRAMQKIGERQYDIEIPDTGRQDEIGDLSRTLELMLDRLKAFDEKLAAEKAQAEAQEFSVTELRTGLQRLANGDFTATLEQKFASEYEPLRTNYNDSIKSLGSTISKLKRFSHMIESQTTSMHNEADDLSKRTENQAATLEETAAAIDEITGSIKQSSDELKSAERLVHEVDSEAKHGSTVIQNTTNAMGEIEKSSEEIGSIIRVVDDIAFQTNLLALNAGVEAARAGDAGRGFAVVAAEVRQLAMRSTEAVSQIKQLVEKSATNVDTGVKLVRDTEAVLLEIAQRINGISEIITSVANNAIDQSSSIGEINVGVTNLDRVTQQNAQMVESSTTSVGNLRTEAAKLVELLEIFNVSDGEQNVVAFASRNATQPQNTAHS